mmetsp:Transcript_59255/g.152506  ORF Transcript_59255/g.152506 Transcript_59255/m.152506 type:complete len:296 (-) Transcript_59255:66-953(-)
MRLLLDPLRGGGGLALGRVHRGPLRHGPRARRLLDRAGAGAHGVVRALQPRDRARGGAREVARGADADLRGRRQDAGGVQPQRLPAHLVLAKGPNRLHELSVRLLERAHHLCRRAAGCRRRRGARPPMGPSRHPCAMLDRHDQLPGLHPAGLRRPADTTLPHFHAVLLLVPTDQRVLVRAHADAAAGFRAEVRAGAVCVAVPGPDDSHWDAGTGARGLPRPRHRADWLAPPVDRHGGERHRRGAVHVRGPRDHGRPRGRRRGKQGPWGAQQRESHLLDGVLRGGLAACYSAWADS